MDRTDIHTIYRSMACMIFMISTWFLGFSKFFEQTKEGELIMWLFNFHMILDTYLNFTSKKIRLESFIHHFMAILFSSTMIYQYQLYDGILYALGLMELITIVRIFLYFGVSKILFTKLRIFIHLFIRLPLITTYIYLGIITDNYLCAIFCFMLLFFDTWCLKENFKLIFLKSK